MANFPGTGGDDSLTGSDGDDVLTGGEGNDALDGGDGIDVANYENATGSVVVDLSSGSCSGGAGIDTLIRIENVTGSAFSDTLTADNGDNILIGNAGDDTLNGGIGFDALEGGVGNDVLDGGDGNDWARYGLAAGSVVVNLASGTSSGADGNDTLISIENVLGG